MWSTSIWFGYPILSRWNLLQPVPIFARHACFYTNWQKPSVSFNIISIRKLTSFFSWVKIAKGKTGGSSEQTKPFAVSFCAGWKYLAIGHCCSQRHFGFVCSKTERIKCISAVCFAKKWDSHCINNFVRTMLTLLSKNIIYKNNTYILEKKFGWGILREINHSVK